MQPPSSAQPTLSKNHPLYSTDQLQEPSRSFPLLHHSLPVDPQSPFLADPRPINLNSSGASLHPSLTRNDVSQHTPNKAGRMDYYPATQYGQFESDCPNICIAADGIECYCLLCMSRENSIEPRNIASKYTRNSIESNSFGLTDSREVSLGVGILGSVDQASSYSYSDLPSSSTANFTSSSYESVPASHTSSSIPQEFSSFGYLGHSQLFGSSSATQGFADRSLGVGNFPANTFSSRNMGSGDSGRQELGVESFPEQNPARPQHSGATAASPMPNSSNWPDFEIFLDVQEYLDVALKPGSTLPHSRKPHFAAMLGISTAQLESCIKARHEILPILNALIPASANLGMPADQVVGWLRKIESQSLTENPPIDSAYQSHANTLSGEHLPKKKRKLNARDESSSKPYQCTHIDSNGRYCPHEFRTSTDWKRHEEIHWPQKRWEFLIQGSSSTASCHICSGNIDLAGQQVVNDHAACIGVTYRREHSFPRKDKLQCHVKNCHNCIANIENWYRPVASDWKRQCGFCGSTWTEWDTRCEHVGQHFMAGKRMLPDWRDPWYSDTFQSSQGGDDDGDDHDDHDDHDDDEDDEDNHGDNDDRFNDLYAEPGKDWDSDRGGPGRFQEDIPNGSTNSNFEGQRHKACSISGNKPWEAAGGTLKYERPMSDTANCPSSPLPPRHQGSEAPKNFKHIRKLGYGSFGAVDEVEHYASKLRFARKTIRLSPRYSALSLVQAQREVTTLRRLKHQHIINILASYKWDGHLAIIMFPVAERNLSEFLLAENAISLPQVSKLSSWIGCLISALSYIHRNFCYHMDLKPNNILIYGNHVMLADFGGALITESPRSNDTLEKASIITPMYCAPEIAYPDASLFILGASDVYSLGCIFLEMATVIHREKLQTFVDFRAFGSSNSAYNSTSRKISIWIDHLSYIDESLGLPQQKWLKVIRKMLSVNGKKRPTAKDIVDSYFVDNIPEKKEKAGGEKYLVGSNIGGSLALIEAARLWLEECLTSHEKCHKSTTNFVPTRLLDVGTHSNLIQLQSTFEGLSSTYATLSHCWGTGLEIPKTTTQTLESMMSGIEISSLPSTYADAVQVTKALGIRYFWIDSLCIIQDSQEDWIMESSHMGSIYSHSSVNIAATGGNYSINAEPGVPDCEPTWSKSRALCNSCSNGHAAFEALSENTATTMLFHSPLWTRGWVLQERLLSPRILHFCSDRIAWECNSSSTTLDTVSHFGKALRMSYCQSQKTTPPDPNIDLPARISNQSMSLWRDIVRKYSKLELSLPQDKLPALAGIAGKIAAKTRHTYIAGLWAEDLLPTGLLWSRDFATIPLARPPYRAPSWSWASLDSHITWSRSLPEGNVVAQAEIIRWQILPYSRSSPFGAVSDGYIVIKGHLKRVTVTRAGSEQLLKRRSLTPFAFAQWDVLEDVQEATGTDGVKQDRGWMPWCLNAVKGVGLILRKKKTGYFQRVGIYWIQDQNISESEMNDEWELRTITII